jgi:hypothetical protein
MGTMPVTLAAESFPAGHGTSPFSVVLRDFGPAKLHRYVTHCRNDDPGIGGHFWGHYFNDEAEARADFAARAARYRRT